MANSSGAGFGDVVLVPFPFTDQSGTKKRPAVVVSSDGYNASRRDIVIMAVTSQVRTPLGFGEGMIDDWQGGARQGVRVQAGLHHHRAVARASCHGAPLGGRQ
jgi:hypothetical protein